MIEVSRVFVKYSEIVLPVIMQGLMYSANDNYGN